MANSESDIVFCEPRIKVHTFDTSINEKAVIYNVLQLKDSIFVWIGYQDAAQLKDLSLAMISYVTNAPLSTKILGPHLDETSKRLSTRLCIKLKKPVYVSYNVTTSDMLFPFVEKRLLEEMKAFPEKF